MDVEQIERMLHARPAADAAYVPVVADFLGVPSRQRPTVGRPTWRHGSSGQPRLVVVLVVTVAIILASLLAIGGGWVTQNEVSTPSPTLATATPANIPAFPGGELIPLTWDWALARQPGNLPFGAAVGVAQGGRIWGSAYGAHEADSLMRLGATSRIYLVAIALQLVDEGRLELDSPVSRYVSSWTGAPAITIRQLLDGSSGVAAFGEPVEALAERVDADPPRFWAAADGLSIAADKAPRFAPGARHELADTEDALLAASIETVTGSTINTLLHTRILDPLALKSTFPSGAAVPPSGSAQASEQGAEMFVGLWDPTNSGTLEVVPDLPAGVLAVLGPARGMASTASNLARAGDALHTDPALLSDAARALIDRSIDDNGFGGSAMCPCNGAAKTGVGMIGHTGPYSSLSVYVPSQRLTIAILVNTSISDDDLSGLLQQIYDLVSPAFK